MGDSLGPKGSSIGSSLHVSSSKYPKFSCMKVTSQTCSPTCVTPTFCLAKTWIFLDWVFAHRLVTNEVASAEGAQLYQQMTFKPDGLEYPIATKGSPVIQTIALKRPDRLNVEYTLKVDGKVTSSVRGVMSKDGKTYTETVKGTNSQGRPVSNTVVFEKQ